MSNNIALEVDLIIVPALSEVLVGEMPDKVRQLRFDAIRALRAVLSYYCRENLNNRLILGIAEKKVKMIMSATTKADMEAITKPKAPRFDGNKFIPAPFSVPEEELIGWGKASLRAPLNSAGFKRCSEVFKEVFPEHWDDVFGPCFN